jgi:hypothetical protein
MIQHLYSSKTCNKNWYEDRLAAKGATESKTTVKTYCHNADRDAKKRTTSTK